MVTTSTNGRARKSLAEQIDRLDSILDGLAENLNDAVATAAVAGVKDVVTVAVQEAVHAALVEVLSNAEGLTSAWPLNRFRTTSRPRLPSVRWRVMLVVAGWLREGCLRQAVAVARSVCSNVKDMLCPLFANATAKAKQVREDVVQAPGRAGCG